MPLYVIDANVAVKWVLSGEAYEEIAAKIKSDQVLGITELCAPSFMVQEVTNSIWRAIKLGRITKEKAGRALTRFDSLGITFYDLDWKSACEELSIASELDLAIYDAAYLFLGKKLNAKLVTADDKMYQKAKGNFSVLHLKEYL